MKNRAFSLLMHFALVSLLAILMACGGGGSNDPGEPSDRDNPSNPSPGNPATPLLHIFLFLKLSIASYDSIQKLEEDFSAEYKKIANMKKITKRIFQ